MRGLTALVSSLLVSLAFAPAAAGAETVYRGVAAIVVGFPGTLVIRGNWNRTGDRFIGHVRCRPRALCVAKRGRFLAAVEGEYFAGTAFYPRNVQCFYDGKFTTGCILDGGMLYLAASDPRDLICGGVGPCTDMQTGRQFSGGAFAVKRVR
jgi:hypothetical protein